MANKPRVLGNDPFQRGAAPREGTAPAEQKRPTPGKKSTTGGGTARKRTVSKPGRQGTAAAEQKKPAPGKKKSTAGGATAQKRTVSKGAPGKAPAPASQTATAAPGTPSRPQTPPASPVAKAAAPGARSRPQAAPMPPATPVAKAAAPGAPSTPQAAPAPAPVGPPPHEASLLPSDLASAPREPRVQAVAPVASLAPPALPLEEAPKPQPGDVTRAGIKALRLLFGLPAAAPSFDVDELGKDAAFEEQTRPFFDWVYESWFRVESSGLSNLPSRGPVILVANRAGALPWDSLMLSAACRRAGREVRPLVEDDIFHFPSVGVLINRLGAVRACPENAEWVLDRQGAIAVFPEGATGFGKPYAERYRLQRFGRGGFVKLALRTSATIVPVSIVGAEETHPLLAKLPARPLGIPFVPVTPTFPWLGAAGLIPLPSRWYIDVGEPFDLSSHGPAAASDDPLVLRIADTVRGTIQAMLDTRLSRRRSVFRG